MTIAVDWYSKPQLKQTKNENKKKLKTSDLEANYFFYMRSSELHKTKVVHSTSSRPLTDVRVLR